MIAVLAVGGLLAGLATATSKPPLVHAAAPTPGIVNSFAGGGTTGYATSIQIVPWGLALSGSTLFIADDQGPYVYALNTSTGVETVYAGNGTIGSSGDGGQATSAALNYPRGLALDGSGNLFIHTDNRLRMVTPGGVISTVAGGGAGCTEPCLATSAVLSGADGVSVDAAGTIFIADTGDNEIKKVSAGTITTFAGTGTAGFSGDTGDPTAAQLNQPEAVYVDGAGDVWIADTGNHRVRKVDHTTGKIDTVAGDSTYVGNCDVGTATSVSLFSPTGLSMDGSGNLLITDEYDQCVRALSGTTLTKVAGVGPGVNGSLGLPINAISDGAGGYFISDVFAPGRVVHGSGASLPMVAGNDGTTCAVYGIGGQATAARLCRPYDVALGGSGDVFVADFQGERVLKINGAGVLSSVAGTGQAGMSGDGGPATAAQLNGPAGLAFDGAGNLYISDMNNYAVRRVDHITGTISTVAGTLGSYGFSGDGGPATSAKLFGNSGITFDAAGDLFIADSGNYRVRKVTPAGVISTFAGRGSCCGTPYVGPAVDAYLNAPTGVAIDAGGNVFITQTGPVVVVDTSGNISLYAAAVANNVLRLAIGPAGQVVATANWGVTLVRPAGAPVQLAGSLTNSGGYSGDGGPALDAKFGYLYGMAIDATGDIYVADLSNRRIRRIQAYTAPNAPSGVTATPGRNMASVKWAVPSDTGGLPIDTYVVTPYTGSTPPSTVTVTESPAATSVTVQQLANGSAYTFTVSASNGWLSGPASGHSAPVTPTAAALGRIVTLAGSVGVGGPGTVGMLPYAVAAGYDNGVGHVFVGDLANPVVRDIAPGAAPGTIAAGNDGYGYAGDGGPATSALMQGATAIADCGGTKYIADDLNYAIRMVDTTGKITTVAGTGQKGFSGDGGPGTQAKLGRVLGLACRTGGGIYISDSDNGRIRILDGAGIIYTWYSGFSFPTGITELLNINDDVVVSDAGGDNAVYELTDSHIYLVAGVPGHPGSSGDGGPALSAKLNDPRGLAWTGSAGGIWLFVADRGNNRIRLIASGPGSVDISAFAGNGTRGYLDAPAKNAEFNQPAGIALGPDGTTLFIADTGNLRVRTVFTWGSDVSTASGNGTASLSGDGGPATSAQLGIPYAVTFDSAGNEYIADNQNDVIRKVDVNGVITTFAGNGTAGFAGDHGPAASAKLNDPRGVAADSLGNVYISDAGNQRIRKVASDGTITTFAGSGIAGYSGDGASALNARMRYPEALAADAAGNVYIADTGNDVVRKVSSAGTISKVAGTGVAGFSGDSGLATGAMLNQPAGLALDAAGDLFIADAGNNRVRVVNHASATITTFAGDGAAGFTGDGHAAIGAELNRPVGLAMDGAGNLYVSDSRNQRIRVVDTGGNISTVVGACGVLAGFAGDGGAASSAKLNFPAGIAVDSPGDLYVADLANNRVRVAFGVLIRGRAATCPAPIPSPTGSRVSTTGSPAPLAGAAAGPTRAMAGTTQVPAESAQWTPGHIVRLDAGPTVTLKPPHGMRLVPTRVKHGVPAAAAPAARPAQIGVPAGSVSSTESATAVAATAPARPAATYLVLLIPGLLLALLVAQRRRWRRIIRVSRRRR